MSTNASVVQATSQATTQASSTPTSSDDVSTSTTPAPATTAAATSPSPSSPAQTSAAAPTTTSSSGASSTALSASVAPTTNSSSLFTTQVATTLFSTDSAGATVFVTTSAPEVVSTSIGSSTGSSSSSSHTGAIVGGVVGGVAGITLLALLFYCIRRRARKDEFDGNFDPDRVVGTTNGRDGTLPHIDLAEEVTPFPRSYADQGGSDMRQYGESPHLAVSTFKGASGYGNTEVYPHAVPGSVDTQSRLMQPSDGSSSSGAYLPPVNLYGAGPMDWHDPRPGVSPPPSTASIYTSSTRATKEREALGRGGQGTGLGLATQPEIAEGSGDVVVHEDAGRAPAEEHAPPREIPPAYESIQRD